MYTYPAPPELPADDPRPARSSHSPLRLPGADLFESLSQGWQVDELAAQINQESQARIAFAGLNGVGKRLLYNRLRGWVIQWPDRSPLDDTPRIEPLGLFVLADLPATEDAAWWQQAAIPPDSLLTILGDPALIVYLLDATRGITQADYRWIAALRTGGRPLVVALNKLDLTAQQQIDAPTAQQRLGLPVIPIAALTGLNVETRLLPAMLNAAPRLAVPLAREIAALRRHAARRVIRQSALLAGLLGLQPLPGLELPFLAILHSGVVLRIGAAYGYQPGGGLSREVLATVAAVVLLQYVGQTAAKLIPLLGSAVGGALSAAATFLIGETAIHYYEAGAAIPPIALRRRLMSWRLSKTAAQTSDDQEIPIWESATTAPDNSPAR